MKTIFSLLSIYLMVGLWGVCYAQPSFSPLIIDAQLACFGGNLSVEFLVQSKSPLTTNVGILTASNDSSYVLKDVEAGQIVTFSQIFGQDTLRTRRAVPVVETKPLPTPLVSSLTVCSRQPLGTLQALPSDGITVDWYDAPAGGKLLAANQPTFSPSAPGRYYAESRDTQLPCRAVSGRRGEGRVTVVKSLCPVVLLKKISPGELRATK